MTMLDMTMVAVLSVVLSDRFELVSDWTVRCCQTNANQSLLGQ